MTGEWDDTNGDREVTASGDAIATGGEATISATARGVTAVRFEDLWTDWADLADEAPDGGTPTNDVAEDGTYEVTWETRQEVASPSITVAPPPDTYVGGEFEVTVVAVDGTEARRESATVQVE